MQWSQNAHAFSLPLRSHQQDRPAHTRRVPHCCGASPHRQGYEDKVLCSAASVKIAEATVNCLIVWILGDHPCSHVIAHCMLLRDRDTHAYACTCPVLTARLLLLIVASPPPNRPVRGYSPPARHLDTALRTVTRRSAAAVWRAFVGHWLLASCAMAQSR